jgi:transcriptional regulator with XRE-family HTH domain
MKFGKTVRKLREQRELSIAEFARKVGMSPTYLAPIEREVFPPPAEEKIVRIARALDQDPDEFLALAGRVSTDLQGIILRCPTAAARLLRAIRGLDETDIDQLVARAETLNGKSRPGSSSDKGRARSRKSSRSGGSRKRD